LDFHHRAGIASVVSIGALVPSGFDLTAGLGNLSLLPDRPFLRATGSASLDLSTPPGVLESIWKMRAMQIRQTAAAGHSGVGAIWDAPFWNRVTTRLSFPGHSAAAGARSELLKSIAALQRLAPE